MHLSPIATVYHVYSNWAGGIKKKHHEIEMREETEYKTYVFARPGAEGDTVTSVHNVRSILL